MNASDQRPYLRGVLLSGGGMLVISPDGLLLRLLEDAGIWQVIFYRSLFMGIVLALVLALFYRRRVVAVVRGAGPSLIVSGVLLAGTNLGFISSIMTTTVANTLVILATMPLFGALCGWILIREPVRPRTMAAIGLAFAGILVIFWGSIGGGRWLGDLLAVVTALLHGLNLAVLRRAGNRDMTPAVCLSGFIAAAVALALTGGDTAVSAHDLRILAFLGFVMVPLALTMFIAGTRTVPAAEVALLALMETVFGPLWAWLGVGEVPTTESFIGGSLVIAAVVLNSTLALLGRQGRRRTA